MPDRREQLITGLMLCYALGREEAEHFVRMHDAEQMRAAQELFAMKSEPEVFFLPLKWWRLGRDAVLSVFMKDVLPAYMADEDFDEKGHKK